VTMATCALSKNERALVVSHIIPRFIGKGQKADAPRPFLGYFLPVAACTVYRQRNRSAASARIVSLSMRILSLAMSSHQPWMACALTIWVQEVVEVAFNLGG
jgi:hypothetical protein